MNFRIDLPHDQVIELCKENKYREILAHDEFRLAQANQNDPCSSFKEAEIDFAPTYKFDLRYDNDVYAKHRTPSYTVRNILTKNWEQYNG